MKVDEIIDEKILLTRLRNGDHAAFEQLYHHYKRHIVGHLLGLFKDQEIAQDIAQDTFIKIWENRAQLDEQKSFKAYLFTIATNNAYTLFQRIGKDEKARLSFRFLLQHVTDQVDDYIAGLEHQELLESLLALLPERQREVFRLFKVDGYSYAEISEQLGISSNTINTHLKRATNYLRNVLLRRPDLLLALLITQAV